MELIWLQGRGHLEKRSSWPARALRQHHLPQAPGHSLSTMTPQPRATGRQRRASECAESSQGRVTQGVNNWGVMGFERTTLKENTLS